MKTPLLSICIPAYNRPAELVLALHVFASQIAGKYEDEIEILVCDDASPDRAMGNAAMIAEKHPFIRFTRYQENLGLEQNLLACTKEARGEYLWIFGDDDFLETDDALDVLMEKLRRQTHDFYILNRSRRSFDLSQQLTSNWMQIDPSRDEDFDGLPAFFRKYGFISVIGFISVNIFRRAPFATVDPTPYFGTMYPQLGVMAEAFARARVRLIARPMVCHRTQTAEEKRAALGDKASEAAFMSGEQRRNAVFFGHPFVSMVRTIVEKGALQASDVAAIPENTVIQGPLVEFLLNSIQNAADLKIPVTDDARRKNAAFLAGLPLSGALAERARGLAAAATGEVVLRAKPLTISVVSPSYNQAAYFRDCLSSVKSQTYQPIEHLVFDPGSTDGSRDIALAFPHATLIAEPDKGQSDALNKGFRRAKGDIIAWVNSDDAYFDHTVFETVVKRFLQPDQPDIVYGRGVYLDTEGAKLRDCYINTDPTSLPWRFQQEDGILQPALFMRRSVIEKVGPLREDRHFCMDYEYWIRCVKAGVKFAFVDQNFAVSRYHTDNKTYGQRGSSYAEVCDMMVEHFGYANHIWLRRYAEFLADGHDGVLAHAQNAGVADAARLDAIYEDLLRAYNANQLTWATLNERAHEKGYGDTLREMKARGIGPSTPCREIPLDQTYEPNCVTYAVGERRWAFDKHWKAAQIAKAHGFLRREITRREKDVCVIVGNGPSLNRTDLDALEGQDVIISNYAYLNRTLARHAKYYTVVNYLVAEQGRHQINRLTGMAKVLPYWLSYCLNEGDDAFFMDAIGYAEFSRDMFENMSWRHTVTFFNFHLAYGLGYRKVLLIGMDHSYKQAPGVVEQEIIQETSADENHFDPAYFQGKKWQAADVDMMEEMYRLAKTVFEEDGREVVNCTVGGKLELFRRGDLAGELRG